MTPYRLRSGPAFLLLLSSLVAQGCGQEAPPTPEPELEQPRVAITLPEFTPPKNCLFVILDAFHGKHASHLGYHRETTPNLDRLAAEGVAFEHAYSQSSNTLTSAFSYFLSQYPPGRPDQDKQLALAPDDYTLAEAFHDAGFRTGAFTESPWINPKLGFDQGFDILEYAPPITPKKEGTLHRPRVPNATEDLITTAQSWIAENDAPWFCYLHVLRPHNPYGAPEPFGPRFSEESHGEAALIRETDILATREGVDENDEHGAIPFLIDRYDANIAYTDYLLGQLIEWLERRGELDETLIIVASDHGEAFRQHGYFLHNVTVNEEMIHVPLVIRAPKSVGFAQAAIQSPVEMLDLYPTLSETFSLNEPTPMDGISLLPLLFGTSSHHKDELFSQTAYAEMIAVRKGARKLILQRRGYSRLVPFALYDLTRDPDEITNLLDSSQAPTDLLALAEWYKQERYLRPHAAAQALDPDQEDQLRALGYLE